MRPIVVIEHEPDAPAGLLGEWLDDREIPWRVQRSGEQTDGVGDACAVVSLGSSHAAYEDAGWVPGHIALLRRVVSAEIPVLGLCFGAQALGVALGGAARLAALPEIGWVQPQSAVPELCGPWFSWHFDSVTPPASAAILATTDRAVQAFTNGPHVGLQFHPEVTPAIVQDWIDQDRDVADQHGGPDLRASVDASETALRAQAFALFDWWRSHAVGS